MEKFSTKHMKSSFLIKRIFKDYIRHHSSSIIYALVMMVISSAATGFHAWLVQPALDYVLINSDKDMLIIIPLVIIITTFIKGVATYIHTVQMSSIAHKVISKLQTEMFTKLMFIDLSYYGDSNSGNLISRLINDTSYLRMAIIKTSAGLIKDTLVIIFLITNMFYQSWQLALFSFFAFPLAIWPIVKIGNKIRDYYNNNRISLVYFHERNDYSTNLNLYIRALQIDLNLENDIRGAVEQYVSDVRSQDFPNSEEQYE